MDENIKNQTLDQLTKANSVYVIVSPSSGIDGLASGLALFLSLKKLGKNVEIFAKPPTVGDAQTLYGVDAINKKGEGTGNLAIIVNNAVENVDKVTYSLEGDKLRIVVNALAGSKGVSPQDVSFEKTAGKPDLIFTINISSPDELRKEIPHEQNIDSNCWIVSLTDLDMNQKFAQLEIKNPDTASLSELTVALFQTLALPAGEDIAYNLYIGISEATASFSPSLARPETLKAAEWLIKFGAGRASLALSVRNRKQTSEKKIEDIELNLNVRNFNQDLNVQETSQQAPAAPVQATPIPSGTQQPVPVKPQEAWFKPPKIYKGSKSFDSES